MVCRGPGLVLSTPRCHQTPGYHSQANQPGLLQAPTREGGVRTAPEAPEVLGVLGVRLTSPCRQDHQECQECPPDFLQAARGCPQGARGCRGWEDLVGYPQVPGVRPCLLLPVRTCRKEWPGVDRACSQEPVGRLLLTLKLTWWRRNQMIISLYNNSNSRAATWARCITEEESRPSSNNSKCQVMA